MAGEGLPGLEKGYWGRRRATGAGEGISGPEKRYRGWRRDIGAGEGVSGLEKGYQGRRRAIGAGEGLSGHTDPLAWPQYPSLLPLLCLFWISRLFSEGTQAVKPA